MFVRASLIALAALSLAACNRSGDAEGGTSAEGSTGGEAAAVLDMPEQFVGTWAADCAQPFVRFEPAAIHVFPDGQTYPLTAAAYDGQALNVTYTAGNGSYQETYVAEGENLRLTSGVYDGAATQWDKLPMQRCE